MKLQHIFLTIFIFSTSTLFSQKENDPKHENHFKQIEPIQTDVLEIQFSDVHAQQAFCLAVLNIKNKTNDYIIIERDQLLFIFEHGEYKPSKKQFIIEPQGSKKFTAKVEGDSKFHVESFALKIRGLSRVATNVPALESEKFQVPANMNNISIGNFNLKLLKSSQETQETSLQFSCKYVGNQFGILDPSNLIITTDKGEWANDSKRSKPVLMQNNNTKKFNAVFHIPGKIIDMQFATMHIDWKETFKESEAKALEGFDLSFEIDPGLTAGKNK